MGGTASEVGRASARRARPTAMAIVAQGNLKTAATYRHVNRALAAAETGLWWAGYRIEKLAGNITTTRGKVDHQLAADIWFGTGVIGEGLRHKIIYEMGDDGHYVGPGPHVVDTPVETGNSLWDSANTLRLDPIPVGPTDGSATFQIIIERHPLEGVNYDSGYYQRPPYNIGGGENRFTVNGAPVSESNPVAGFWIRITSIGRDGGYKRVVRMDFRLDKKIRFAILSRNRIMIGRNVIIKGSVGSKYTMTGYKHGHPVQIKGNFYGLDPQLNKWLDALRGYLAKHDHDGDNRIALHGIEPDFLNNAATYDNNGDGYVDSYDMFLLKYDTSGGSKGGPDGAITRAEFTGSSGNLVNAQLWQLINEAKYPPGTEFDWDNMRIRKPGSSNWIDASADMSVINDADNYAKIHGEVILAAAKAAWENGAADGPYQEFLKGPINPDPHDAPLTFEADKSKLAEYDGSTFEMSAYEDMATGNFHAQVASQKNGHNYVPQDAGPIEAVPYGSPHPYDYYQRPVYKNMTFRNVTIPMGTNALFKNCKFIGVTFIETAQGNADPNFNYAGMQGPAGKVKYTYIGADVDIDGDGTVDVHTKKDGKPNGTKPYANNIRFHDCTFVGMVASASPKKFTHIRNKLQFTGRTKFDLHSPELSPHQEQMFHRSTIMAPQYSVEMGTFTEPLAPDEVTTLSGTIVAGVLDIRGQARINGSIITTYQPKPGEGLLRYGGSPAAFNTTIGYFSASEGDAESEVPANGYGKIIINYDPTRALPDGILGPIDFRPALMTYFEGRWTR